MARGDSANPDSSAAPGRKPGLTVLADDDIRRDLEQRALRNSRALVDKLEEEEQEDRRLQRKATWVFAILMACIGIIAVLVLATSRSEPPVPVQFPKPGFEPQSAPR